MAVELSRARPAPASRSQEGARGEEDDHARHAQEPGPTSETRPAASRIAGLDDVAGGHRVDCAPPMASCAGRRGRERSRRVLRLLLAAGFPQLMFMLTLVIALYLTVIELREMRPRPHWKWWAWWLSFVFPATSSAISSSGAVPRCLPTPYPSPSLGRSGIARWGRSRCCSQCFCSPSWRQRPVRRGTTRSASRRRRRLPARRWTSSPRRSSSVPFSAAGLTLSRLGSVPLDHERGAVQSGMRDRGGGRGDGRGGDETVLRSV